MFTRFGLVLPACLLLAALPAAAQEAVPTGMWEGRWQTEGRSYQVVADDVIGLAPGDRQARKAHW